MKICNSARITLAFAAILLIGVAPIRGQEATPAVSLPDVNTSNNVSPYLTAAVTTTDVEEEDNVNGFTGYFTFDERIVTFPTNGATNAGLTADTGEWHVYGALLPGSGPIRRYVLTIWADLPSSSLSGSGTLCNLSLTRVTSTSGSTDLTWEVENSGYWDGNLEPYPTELVDGHVDVFCLINCSP